jgi:uncharacterized membrane protein YdbT with pleckstrin-like domain
MYTEHKTMEETIMEFKERKRWIFLGLPFTFTVYTIKEEVLTIDKGFFNKEENDCFMYKVQDVTLKRSLWERIFGLGTVVCYTGDVTDAVLKLEHIKNAKAVKNFILEQSELERRKRRTLNTLDIGAADMDLDGCNH